MIAGIGRKTRLFSTVLTVGFVLPFFASAQNTGWTCVTRPDVWITATAIGPVWSDPKAKALAEYPVGVLAKISGGTWDLLKNFGTGANPLAKRMVNDLLFPVNSLLWAATDSGLYAYRFTSGIPPIWTEIAGVPADSVFSIRFARGSAFVLLRHDILRSDDTGRSWRSVRPPYTALLTALAVTDSVCVAGAVAQSTRSHRTVWLSRDLGTTWQDISSFPADVQMPSPAALAVVRENNDTTHQIIAACKEMIYFCSVKKPGDWRAAVSAFPSMTRIHDLMTIGTLQSPMHWIALGSDSGLFLLNTTVDHSKWENVFTYPTYRFARDTGVTTSLICAATFDGLREWRRDITANRVGMMTRLPVVPASGTKSAFDLRGRLLGERPAKDAVNLHCTGAGKRSHGVRVQAEVKK